MQPLKNRPKLSLFDDRFTVLECDAKRSKSFRYNKGYSLEYSLAAYTITGYNSHRNVIFKQRVENILVRDYRTKTNIFCDLPLPFTPANNAANVEFTTIRSVHSVDAPIVIASMIDASSINKIQTVDTDIKENEMINNALAAEFAIRGNKLAERWGTEDSYDNGDMIRLSYQHNDDRKFDAESPTYTAAFVKTVAGWYSTLAQANKIGTLYDIVVFAETKYISELTVVVDNMVEVVVDNTDYEIDPKTTA